MSISTPAPFPGFPLHSCRPATSPAPVFQVSPRNVLETPPLDPDIIAPDLGSFRTEPHHDHSATHSNEGISA